MTESQGDSSLAVVVSHHTSISFDDNTTIKPETSYGTIDSEDSPEVPSNVSVALTVIGMLSAVFIAIGVFGAIFIHDEMHRNHLFIGLFSTYLLAFCLAVVLGGGLAFLELPEYLNRWYSNLFRRIATRDELL